MTLFLIIMQVVHTKHTTLTLPPNPSHMHTLHYTPSTQMYSFITIVKIAGGISTLHVMGIVCIVYLSSYHVYMSLYFPFYSVHQKMFGEKNAPVVFKVILSAGCQYSRGTKTKEIKGGLLDNLENDHRWCPLFHDQTEK